jgi:hypothetical protein
MILFVTIACTVIREGDSNGVVEAIFHRIHALTNSIKKRF